MFRNVNYIVIFLVITRAFAGNKPTSLDVVKFSQKFRNWYYYTGGDFGGFVVPPNAGNFRGQLCTDTALVFEKTTEDTLPGKYRLTYLFFNNTAGNFGYETALAISDDLVNWRFGQGGDNGLIFRRNPTPGTYDYGGVTFGGLHFTNASLTARRQLKKMFGRYHGLYGCYPLRSGYEAGNGGQGMAWSTDGVVWDRISNTVPALSGGSNLLKAWESSVVYQPFLVEDSNGDFWDFYNAAGVNEFGVGGTEETGLANLPGSLFPGLAPNSTASVWVRNPVSPVVPSGEPGSCDTKMASDPKVFWDGDQGVWVMFYFGLGDGTQFHADIMVAFSFDLVSWAKDPVP